MVLSWAFVHALRRGRFGPFARSRWSFTPPLLAKGQPKLVVLPLAAHRGAPPTRRFLPFGPSLLAQLLCPLLTSAARSERIAPPSVPIPGHATASLQRATAESTTSALDGYGLRDPLPARPAPYASYPVLVHRLASLLHAAFRPRLATTPWRFAINSPPSGCEGDLHPKAVKHARHAKKALRWLAQGFVLKGKFGFSRGP
jgi:hypothetical protein